ncbi:MAG: helix-turn-helix domain-containing protein [Anaerolineales bacterium]
MIHIAVLAPTPALRSGLRAMLAGREHFEIVAEAASVSDLGELDGLDVLLIADESLRIENIKAIFENTEPPPAVLLLSEQPDAARRLNRLPLRAWGMLPPEATEEELAAAVTALHQGLLAASPALVQPLIGAAPATQGTDETIDELTGREQEVLQILAQGLANKQIALRLGISEHTVKFHVSAIYSKLGVTNRTEALRRGARLGLIVL